MEGSIPSTKLGARGLSSWHLSLSSEQFTSCKSPVLTRSRSEKTKDQHHGKKRCRFQTARKFHHRGLPITDLCTGGLELACAFNLSIVCLP